MRINSTGLHREDLLWALQQENLVMKARQRDSCLLCRASRVNEAGVCRTCHALLRDEELRIVERWMSGNAP